ncbi:hypothetical protein EDD37DRAFT_172658 [Exophiala viscosa]|uniref:uncharacterized protein n=1 Tax=Exophiala viscosa TaxID=2486360 RepID=UPI002197DDE7|nr:hypothetical protein EDD37DRAFT_172658 [Exophiala viscosa]
MTAEDEHAPAETFKTSKRDKFKGALSRTKSKFKKNNDKSEETEQGLSADVNEFLAAGRTSTSSWNSQNTTPHSPATHGFSSTATSPDQQSPRPSTSDSSSTIHKPPRKLVVPRIDVSNSQRWPAAQPVRQQGSLAESDFLRPEYHSRSQSASSLSKRKGRARGLSVAFDDDPPVIIGEGGDDAPTPPMEISKAKSRARSASPMSTRQPHAPGMHHSPTAAHTHFSPARGHDPPDVLRPRGLQRIQTGTSPTSAASRSSALDREFEMTLRLGAGHNSPDSQGSVTNTPEIVSPRPVRPIKPPPPIMEIPHPSGLRKEVPRNDRTEHLREGDILRLSHQAEVHTPRSNERITPGQRHYVG